MQTTQTLPLTGDIEAESDNLTELPPGDIGGEDLMADMDFSRPIEMANHICSNTKQHVVLLRDSSGSMSGSKIDELNLATIALQQELAMPENKEGFFLSVIDFCHFARVAAHPQPAHTIEVPEAIANGGTDFDAALEAGTQIVQDFQSGPNVEGWRYLRPTVLFLSDGQSKVSEERIRDLQEVADVWAIAYGSDAVHATLAKIATDGQVHSVGTRGGELRRFLAMVGKTLSEGMAKG